MNTYLLKALQWRYATKIFDATKSMSADDLHTILESGRLSPSSFGVEPWKFIVVENKELRIKLRPVSYDQPKITDAPYLVVIARRTDARATLSSELMDRTAKAQQKPLAEFDGYKQMVDGSIASKSDAELDAWVRAQTYIALGIMLETAALMGIDACPMEGFSPSGVDEVLGLPTLNLASTTMMALGYRGDDALASVPKTRRSFEEVVQFMK